MHMYEVFVFSGFERFVLAKLILCRTLLGTQKYKSVPVHNTNRLINFFDFSKATSAESLWCLLAWWVRYTSTPPPR